MKNNFITSLADDKAGLIDVMPLMPPYKLVIWEMVLADRFNLYKFVIPFLSERKYIPLPSGVHCGFIFFALSNRSIVLFSWI